MQVLDEIRELGDVEYVRCRLARLTSKELEGVKVRNACCSIA